MECRERKGNEEEEEEKVKKRMGERIEMRLKETKDSQCSHLFGQTKV